MKPSLKPNEYPLLQPTPKPGQGMIITGKKRDGKSRYAVYVFNKFRGPAIYIDPKGKDTYSENYFDESIVKYKATDIKEGLLHHAVLRYLPGSDLDLFVEETCKIIDWVINWKLKYPRTSLLIVLDEAYFFMTRHKALKEITRLIQGCSGLNISWILINPQYNDIPRTFFMQCDYLTLYTYHPVIIEYFQERLHQDITEDMIKHMDVQYNGLIFDWTHVYGLLRDYSMVTFPEGVERQIHGDGEQHDENEDNQDTKTDDGRDRELQGETGVKGIERPIDKDGLSGIGNTDSKGGIGK
jgi:hypothetical protein